MHIYDTLQDLIELTTPPCVIGINTACTYEDEEGQDVEYACDVTLMWYDDQLRASVTAPLCRIAIPEEGKGYDLDSLVFGGRTADWDYWFNVTDLSNDEEDELKALMEAKLAAYDLKQNGCTIEHI